MMGISPVVPRSLPGMVLTTGAIWNQTQRRTGHKPVVSVRTAAEGVNAANQQAGSTRKAFGEWLEEPIREKLERDGGQDG